MVIEHSLAAAVLIGLFIVAAVSLAGWIGEGIRLERLRSENRRLVYENNRLTKILSRKRRAENIAVANEYSTGWED